LSSIRRLDAQSAAALWHLARPHRAALIAGALFMAAESAVLLVLPWLGGRVLGELFADQSWQVGGLLLLAAGLLTAQSILQAIGSALYGRRVIGVFADLRMQLFEHLQRVPLAYINSNQQGRILSILTNDVAVVGSFISHTLVGLLPLAITLVGAVIMMLAIDPVLALSATAAIPLFYLGIKLFGRSMRSTAHELQEAYAQAFSLEEENIEMLPAVKAFSREDIERRRYGEKVDAITRLSIRQQWVDIVLGPGVYWCAAMGALLLLWAAGDRLQTGALGKGALISLLLYASLLTRPVSAFAGVYGQSQRALASLERVLELLRIDREPYNEQAPALVWRGGNIVMKDVTFAYPGRAPVLDGFNLEIGAGETVALIGENGAGKSTIASLILRFAIPQRGLVSIDGQDIGDVNLRSLRESVAVVPQTVFLFNGSVRDNLAWGDPGASGAAIERAAALAQAHDFIVALPQGYETVIGDHGVRLSGGQRQRLALARALLRDPRILIFDEATSMFDPEAEVAFIQSCADLFAGRTVILITHRPASLELADRVVRVEATRPLS